MFANGLMLVGGMISMSSSVTSEKYLLNLPAISVGPVNTLLSASSLMVGNFRLGFVTCFKVSHVDLESPFGRFSFLNSNLILQ